MGAQGFFLVRRPDLVPVTSVIRIPSISRLYLALRPFDLCDDRQHHRRVLAGECTHAVAVRETFYFISFILVVASHASLLRWIRRWQLHVRGYYNTEGVSKPLCLAVSESVEGKKKSAEQVAKAKVTAIRDVTSPRYRLPPNGLSRTRYRLQRRSSFPSMHHAHTAGNVPTSVEYQIH